MPWPKFDMWNFEAPKSFDNGQKAKSATNNVCAELATPRLTARGFRPPHATGMHANAVDLPSCDRAPAQRKAPPTPPSPSPLST